MNYEYSLRYNVIASKAWLQGVDSTPGSLQYAVVFVMH